MSTRSSGPVQSRRLGLLQQHPLACFFVLTYSAAWFLWIGNFPGTPKGRHAVLAIGPTAKPGTGRPPGTAWRSSDALIRRVRLDRHDEDRRAAAAGLSPAQ